VMLSLAAFQSSLCRALRGENTCPVDPGSQGFRFTTSVRRSWCEGRAMVAARTVLKFVPEPERASVHRRWSCRPYDTHRRRYVDRPPCLVIQKRFELAILSLSLDNRTGTLALVE